MKTSLKIIFGLTALLFIALGFAMCLPENPVEGILGMAMATPFYFGIIQNSDDARQERKKIYDEMQSMIDMRKTEKRDFKKEESEKYSLLREKFDALDKMVTDLDADEKRALKMAGLAASKLFAGNAVNPDSWIDEKTGKEIPVLKRNEPFSNSNLNVKQGTLGRIIRGIVLGDWRNVEVEHRSALETSNSGTIVPIHLWPQVVDKSRSKSVVFGSGALFVPMEGSNLTIARVKTDASFEVKPENEVFGENSLEFEPITLKAFTIGALLKVSNELLADSPNAALALETALSNALAAEIDRLALFGAGTVEPLGLFNQIGVESVPITDKLTYTPVVSAWAKVAGNNGEAKTLAANGRDIANLLSQQTDLGFLARPELLTNMQIKYSSVFPLTQGVGENESSAIFGDFSQCIVGLRQNLTIEASSVAGDSFQRNQTALRVIWRGDIATLKPGHFAKITGILAATPAPPLG